MCVLGSIVGVVRLFMWNSVLLLLLLWFIRLCVMLKWVVIWLGLV